MDVFTLLIALVALVLSAAAFRRTGGVSMLQGQSEDARRMAANALGRVEGMVRPHPDEREATRAAEEGVGK